MIIEPIGTGQLILRRLFPGTGRPSLILMIHQWKRCAEIGSSPSFFQNSKIFYSRRGEKTGGTRLPGAIFRNLTGEESRGKRGDKQGGKGNSLLGRSISYGYQTRLGMAHCPPLGNRWMAATVDSAGSEKWRIKLWESMKQRVTSDLLSRQKTATFSTQHETKVFLLLILANNHQRHT